MNSAETSADFQLRGMTDPRLAVHAASAMPAWLWSPDGARILWANPVGVCIVGATDASALASRNFNLDDPRRQQVTQLASRLPPSGAVQLERMRGYAGLGSLLTCACSRLDFPGVGSAILVRAAEPAGRGMTLVERLQQLVAGIDTPIAAFSHDGRFVAASRKGRSLFDIGSLSEGGLDSLRDQALREGRAETSIGLWRLVLQRVGSGGDIGLVAFLKKNDPDRSPDQAPALTEPGPESPRQNPETAPPARTVPSPAEPGNRPSPAPPTRRRHPLRFMWRMDAEGRFSIGSDEFTRTIGMRTAAGFGRLWSEITDVFGLDPEGRIARAVQTRNTWSGITLLWPVDGSDARLRVELSGLPIYDRTRNFAGYRGFGVCRDREGLARLAASRRNEFLFSETSHPAPADSDNSADDKPSEPLQQPTEPDTPVETPKNVLPFRPPVDLNPPPLTPVENHAFNELARQLSARLEGEPEAAGPEDDAEPPVAPGASEATREQADEPPSPAQSAPRQPPIAGEGLVLDLVPSGVMIHRAGRALYANPAFLAQVGYENFETLQEAGGLDALLVEARMVETDMVEADPPDAVGTPPTGSPVTVLVTPPSGAPQQPLAARLFAISWDGEPAHALICGGASAPSRVGQATAEELATIVDGAAEGLLMFDDGGNITACNQSAEALFGLSGDTLTQRNLADLFAPESQGAVRDYLKSLTDGEANLPDHGREVVGRMGEDGLIPLSMTMGRTQLAGPNFFAAFRDLSQSKKAETELSQARRQAERAANAKADVLARISHEIRTPLNSIIGFAEVMIDEKFGSLENERYVEYMKDIRASGERIITFIDDLLDLSRIETGKLDLAFVNQNLNDIVEQCVAVMQPQANRERIIIRTSLAHTLPPIVADAQALRQITLNLIGNSIHLANAGGQVIVSTAVNDFGDVALRVRDSGHSLSEDELAAATEPFRTPPPSDQASKSAGVSLSLTKALVEANRAQFHIKTGPHSGTLIEVVFAQADAPSQD
ncbi:histidine kinase dimerization/phospho-acceptor domain-containing protein [Nitrobacter sp.]|uniref:histidine kinase dimerization/phospho-acceptor domain-containing protein n=1 Tax=Nitrobacter sp. TaxID=29420 RepID=UPI00321F851F